MSPYYTGPVPTAPRFWDMKAVSTPSDPSIDRTYQMPGHFDLRTVKPDSQEVVPSPDPSEYYTPTSHQEGFTTPTAFCTPEPTQISPERQAAMHRHSSSAESPSVSPSPSPTESMFSRSSRPDSATSFVESVDECHGSKRSPNRQRSMIPSLVVTDYDSDGERKPKVDTLVQKQVHPRSMDLRVDAMVFHPNPARDTRQVTAVQVASINSASALRPQVRAPPQYTLPPRSHPYTSQGMDPLPRPAVPATVAPRYKQQVPAFQVVPRRFPTPKPILAMRMAGAPQPPVQPTQHVKSLPQARGFKAQAQQHSTFYDSRGQTFEGKTITVRAPQQRTPAMPLSSVRHLWPASGTPLPNAETNSSVWHPSLQEAQSIISIQQARILKGLSNGVPYGGGLYLPIPFDENFA